jgi:hypothetical protein
MYRSSCYRSRDVGVGVYNWVCVREELVPLGVLCVHILYVDCANSSIYPFFLHSMALWFCCVFRWIM